MMSQRRLWLGFVVGLVSLHHRLGLVLSSLGLLAAREVSASSNTSKSTICVIVLQMCSSLLSCVTISGECVQCSLPELLSLLEHLIVHHFAQLLILLLQVIYYRVQPFILIQDLCFLKALILHLPQILLYLLSFAAHHRRQLFVVKFQIFHYLLQRCFITLNFAQLGFKIHLDSFQVIFVSISCAFKLFCQSLIV